MGSLVGGLRTNGGIAIFKKVTALLCAAVLVVLCASCASKPDVISLTREEKGILKKMGDDIMGVDTNNAVTWNNLNEQGLIFGKPFNNGAYTLRVPSTGTDIRMTGNTSVFIPTGSEFEAFNKVNSIKSALIEEKDKYGWGQDSSGTDGRLRSS